MGDGSVIGTIIGVAIPVVGGALMLVWRSASVTTRVELTLEQLKIELSRVAAMGDAVARIPVIETRLGTQENAVARLVSDIADLKDGHAATKALREHSHSQGEFR